MSGPHTKFYRNKQDGVIAGVCAGIADYTGTDVTWVRIGFLVLALVFGGAPVMIPAYIITALVAPKRPADLYVDREEEKFWQHVRQSPARTTRDIRARFRDIDRRLADIEKYYTSTNRQLADEIESLR